MLTLCILLFMIFVIVVYITVLWCQTEKGMKGIEKIFRCQSPEEKLEMQIIDWPGDKNKFGAPWVIDEKNERFEDVLCEEIYEWPRKYDENGTGTKNFF